MAVLQKILNVLPLNEEQRRFQRVRVNLLGRYMLAEQVDAHALETALFLVKGKNVEYFLQHGHAASSPPHSTLAAQEPTACIVKALLVRGPKRALLHAP